MKKYIFSLALCASVFVVNAQVNLQSEANVAIEGQNAFLDASGYINAEANIGKGLYFPRTDLTKWEFNKSLLGNYSNFKTAFDGMIVYNTATGTIGQNVDGGYKSETQGVKVSVEPGFYYFSNPTADPTANYNAGPKSVAEGKWVKIVDTSELSTGLASGKFWSLSGNENTQEAQLKGQNTDGIDPNTITGGNFIGTTDAKSLTFATNSVARLVIGKDGGLITERVGSRDFDFVLKVLGKAKFDKGLVTSASTYPDYVFDNYFTGKSDENPNYQFKKLHEVEQFIKENNHLPGVTSIKELTKSEAGYDVDNTKLSIQTLEKVEELYLHVIEQQKEIQALKAEVAELKK